MQHRVELKYALGAALVAALAAGWLAWAIADMNEGQAFERGKRAGLEACEAPSRLERASRWMAR